MFSKIKNAITSLIGKLNWEVDKEDTLSRHERHNIRDLLKENHCIILTRHDGHMSTYAIAFANLFLTGKWGHYAHALLNLENEVEHDNDFRFIEATGKGVHYSDFHEAFDSQTGSVALLKPKSMSLEHWTEVMDSARTQLGKPYDTLFDLANDRALSCVELVRVALQAEPDYAKNFANFERMITKSRNLTPQMFYDCPDFEVVYEVRH
jgi:uncharacterized protein YycO